MTPTKERISKVKTCVYSADYRSDSQRRSFTRTVDVHSKSTVVMFATDEELKAIGELFIAIDNSVFTKQKKNFLINALFNSH